MSWVGCPFFSIRRSLNIHVVCKLGTKTQNDSKRIQYRKLLHTLSMKLRQSNSFLEGFLLKVFELHLLSLIVFLGEFSFIFEVFIFYCSCLPYSIGTGLKCLQWFFATGFKYFRFLSARHCSKCLLMGIFLVVGSRTCCLCTISLSLKSSQFLPV